MPRGRPFPPGVSGNPEGRRVERPEWRQVRELAAQYGPEAIQRLVQLMRKGPAPVQLAAAQALLDRAYGKPMQPLEHSGPDGTKLFPPASALTDAQLQHALAVMGALRAELWEQAGNGGAPAS
jgi:hypothetical protein